jgi:hypothetical protein
MTKDDEKLDRIERLLNRQQDTSMEIIEQLKGNERKGIMGIEPRLKKLSEEVTILSDERKAKQIRRDHTVSVFKWLVAIAAFISTLFGIIKYLI